MKNHIITITNPACYDLDPYIGKYCEYTSIDEPDKPFTEGQSWMLPDLSVQRKTTNGPI